MIFARAGTNHNTSIYNLTTVYKHYTTCINLLLDYQGYLGNLSQSFDCDRYPARKTLFHRDCFTSKQASKKRLSACGTLDNLSSNNIHCFRSCCNICFYHSMTLHDI